MHIMKRGSSKLVCIVACCQSHVERLVECLLLVIDLLLDMEVCHVACVLAFLSVPSIFAHETLKRRSPDTIGIEWSDL